MATIDGGERRVRGAALHAGAMAGGLGGIAMVAWLVVFSLFTGRGFFYPLELVAGVVLGGDAVGAGLPAAALGLAIHLAVSTALGVAFAEALRHRDVDAFTEVAGAIVFGLAVWLVATFAILPWADPVLRADPGYAVAWFGSHVAYGAVLGLAQQLRDEALVAPAPRNVRQRLSRLAGGPATVEATTALNLLVGGWLVVSAFIWRRQPGERIEVLLVAAAVIAVGLLARRAPALRWADVVLGAWLVASVWLIPHQRFWSSWSAVAFGLVLVMVPFAELAFPDDAERERAAA